VVASVLNGQVLATTSDSGRRGLDGRFGQSCEWFQTFSSMRVVHQSMSMGAAAFLVSFGAIAVTPAELGVRLGRGGLQ